MKSIKFLVIGLVFFTGLITFILHSSVQNEINSGKNTAVKPIELTTEQDASNAIEHSEQKKIIDVIKFKEKRLDAAEDVGEGPFTSSQESITKVPVQSSSNVVNAIAPQDNIIGSANKQNVIDNTIPLSQSIRNKTGPGSELAPLANNVAPDFETAPITNNTGPGPEFVPIASRNGPGPEFTPLTNNTGPGPQFTPATNTTGPVPESDPANNAGS